MEEVKTIKMTESGQINIPLEIRKRAGLKEGTKIKVIAYKDRVELRSSEEVPEEVMLFYKLSEEALRINWDNPEEDEAWKDL